MVVIPLFVGRPKSIKALEMAMEADGEASKQIMLVAQKSATKDEPDAEDLFHIGCLSNILQISSVCGQPPRLPRGYALLGFNFLSSFRTPTLKSATPPALSSAIWTALTPKTRTAFAGMEAIDKYALVRTNALIDSLPEAYDNYEFYNVIHAVQHLHQAWV